VLQAPRSASQFGLALIDGCKVLRPEWKALLVRHQDRLLLATDAHKDSRWRALLGQLPPFSYSQSRLGAYDIEIKWCGQLAMVARCGIRITGISIALSPMTY